jgi:hypothetical protein
MPVFPAPLAALMLLTAVLAGAVSYVLLFRRDLVKGNPPRWLPLIGWLLASYAVVVLILLWLVVAGTS